MVINLGIEGMSTSAIEQIRLICQRHLGVSGASSPNPAIRLPIDFHAPRLHQQTVTIAPEPAREDKPSPPRKALALLPEPKKAAVDDEVAIQRLEPRPIERVPDFVNPPAPDTAVETPIVDAVAEPVDEPNALYEAQTVGPISYFNYYFEEMRADTGVTENFPVSGSPYLSRGLVGAGIATALVASGFVIGDAISKANSAQTTQPADSKLRQQSATPEAKPTTAAPERVNDAPASTKPSQRDAKTNSKNLPKNVASAPMKPSRLAIEPLVNVPSLPPAPPWLNPSLPTAPSAAPKAKSQVLSQQMAAIPAPTANASAVPSPIAAPESLPSAGASVAGNGSMAATSRTREASTVAPVQPMDLKTKDLGNAQSEMKPAETSADVGRGSAAVEVPIATPQEVAPGFTGSESRAVGQGIQSVLAPTRSTTAPTPQDSAQPASAKPQKATPQSIQDYLALPQQPATRPLTVMSLTSDAAAEATATRQFGSFNVRQVNLQEYQQEWVNSNRDSTDPAIAYGLPAYGFIDYQRQLIVVLQNDQVVQR